MPASHWFRPPRHLLVLFFAVAAAPAAALTWLAWRLLEQDRALESQRIQERLEHAADLIGPALERRLSEMTDVLPGLTELGEDALVVTFDSRGIEAHPPGRLLYYPFLPQAHEAPGHVFTAGESVEFRLQDYPRAIAVFRDLARSEEPLVRAGALVRLGRNLRKNGQHREALAVYEELAQLGLTPVGGGPAELLARQARCVVLQELHRSSELQSAAGSLYADLQKGRWLLDRTSYQFNSQEARRWLAAEPEMPADREAGRAVAAAVAALWEQWPEIRRGEGIPRGWRLVWADGLSILLLWKSTPDKLEALAAGPRYLESQLRRVWLDLGVVLGMTDSGAHIVIGGPSIAGQPQAIRTSADTRLPWTLRIASADPAADLTQLAGRRRLLLTGLAMMGTLILVGGYFTSRAVTRELAVARLQSDFVSAVSHEFRTPLTSMRHLTELLDTGVVTEEERRRQYFRALAHETTRLHRLVESLLNFGRMEAGAIEYRFERIDPTAIAEGVVAEFQDEISTGGHQIELHVDGVAPEIRADPEALARALWNLLDNAVKYSPGRPRVWIDLFCEGAWLAIRVRDEGLGIPGNEQKEIFTKFIRGAAARASNVKGTGIGLATVQHIVRAHGGRVRVESQPGKGSTMTMLLPLGT